MTEPEAQSSVDFASLGAVKPGGSDERTSAALLHSVQREASHASKMREQELRSKDLENQITDEDRANRATFCRLLFALVAFWLGIVLVIVVAQGLSAGASSLPSWYPMLWPVRFALSDKVLVTLLAGTTASVLGLLVAVLSYLFPKRGSGSS